jgi:hypothetical protein
MSHWSSSTVALNGVRAQGGNWSSLPTYCDVVTLSMAWRNQDHRWPRWHRPLGHVAEPVNVDRWTGARDHVHCPPPIFSPQRLSTPSSPWSFPMSGEVLSALDLFQILYHVDSFQYIWKATSGAFLFDFHSANHQLDYTKVVPLYTSSNFAIRILICYSLD